MALVRWEPARELQSLQQLLGIFDTPTTGARRPAPRRWIPAVDLVQDGDSYVLRADLPGLTQDDVRLELDGDVLTLSGERHVERREGDRIERASGSFRRALRLPEGVDADAITARFEHGVLEVWVPKPEERKPRRVAITVGDRPADVEAGDEPAAA